MGVGWREDEILRVAAAELFYRLILSCVLRPPPIGSNMPFSASSWKSRVAVAFDVPVVVMYFFALVPPS